MLHTTFIFDDGNGDEWTIEIEFRVIAGSPRTQFYPGDPDEVDYLRFTCAKNPAMAEAFSTALANDNDLFHAVEEACLEHADVMYELSQCDD